MKSTDVCRTVRREAERGVSTEHDQSERRVRRVEAHRWYAAVSVDQTKRLLRNGRQRHPAAQQNGGVATQRAGNSKRHENLGEIAGSYIDRRCSEKEPGAAARKFCARDAPPTQRMLEDGWRHIAERRCPLRAPGYEHACIQALLCLLDPLLSCSRAPAMGRSSRSRYRTWPGSRRSVLASAMSRDESLRALAYRR